MIMRKSKSGFYSVLTILCIGIVAIPVVMLVLYSLESPINMKRYIESLEEVSLGQTVPIKIMVEAFSWDQYYDVLIMQPGYLRQYLNSVVYTFSITAMQVFLGSLVAFSISCFDVPYKNTIYFLFAVLVLMPFQVLIVPNYFVLRWTNLLNTPWALLLPGFFGPFAVFLIRQYMITIPKSLIEATAIDGGNYWSAFLYVVVPVSKPAIIAASTLLFADIWNMVEQPLALLEDYTLFPLSMSLIDSSKTPGKSAFAAIVLFMIPPSLPYLYYTDDLILGIQLGDLK